MKTPYNAVFGTQSRSFFLTKFLKLYGIFGILQGFSYINSKKEGMFLEEIGKLDGNTIPKKILIVVDLIYDKHIKYFVDFIRGAALICVLCLHFIFQLS